MDLPALHAAIAAVCPILGIQVNDPANKATWTVSYAPGATNAQKSAAASVIAGASLSPSAPPATGPGSSPPATVAAAMNVAVANGEIGLVEGVFNVAMVMYADVGLYMLFFMTPQPDENYYALFGGGSLAMQAQDKTTDGFTISLHDTVGGVAVDPASFGVQVLRVQ